MPGKLQGYRPMKVHSLSLSILEICASQSGCASPQIEFIPISGLSNVIDCSHLHASIGRQFRAACWSELWWKWPSCSSTIIWAFAEYLPRFRPAWTWYTPCKSAELGRKWWARQWSTWRKFGQSTFSSCKKHTLSQLPFPAHFLPRSAQHKRLWWAHLSSLVGTFQYRVSGLHPYLEEGTELSSLRYEWLGREVSDLGN